MPLWQARGWLSEGSARAIVRHYQDTARGGGVFLSMAFALLGVLLLGSGVILFFAANWDVMSKLSRLGLLLGALWVAYGAAGFFLQRGAMPWLGQAFVLLGVLLFGANIMLIAQLYHINAHFPNGVLLWALGGLLAAALMGSQGSVVAALALALLWSWMEIFQFRWAFHWPFLVLLLLAGVPVLRRRWHFALHVTCITFICWSAFVFIQSIDRFHPDLLLLYLLHLYLLTYGLLFFLGWLAGAFDRARWLTTSAQRYTLVVVLALLFGLTFPDLYEGVLRWKVSDLGGFVPWLAAQGAAMTLMAGLMLWGRRQCIGAEYGPWVAWGLGWLLLELVLLGANVLYMHPGLAVAHNLLYFAGLLWLIYAGAQVGDRFVVNVAFVFFTLALLTRYLDTFWTLLDRAVFFIVGGLLLIAGGYFLERQRRKLNREILAQQGGEVT